MLSAVAARKAAKAAAEASSSSSKLPSLPPSKSPSPSPKPSSSSKSNNHVSSIVKRKPPRSSSAGPSKNKKAKVVHVSAKLDRNVRYFDASSVLKAQNESTVEADIGANSHLDSESSSGEELEIEMDIPPPAGLSSSVTKNKRTWSPSRPMLDSSGDEEPDALGFSDPSMYLASALKKSERLPLSTFHPSIGINVHLVQANEYEANGGAVILVLQPNDTIALVGTCSLCVLQGSLSLLGVTLSPSNTKHAIFAPRCSPIPILSWAKSDRLGSCTYLIPPAIRQQENSTAILIERASTGVEGLGRICKIFQNIFRPPRESVALPGIELPSIHIVSYGAKDIHPFVLPSSWETALSSIDDHPGSEVTAAPVCLVKGSKKSGKSTLARTVVNRLLNRYRRVAFLECDLGQSEFTPGGLVALNVVENYLFGPPFAHPSLPYRSHYIGSTSPRASPSHYLHSVQSLLEAYRLDLQFPVTNDEPLPGDERISYAIPLVINTMGWTKGLGADLNARIEDFVEASHIFDVVEEKRWPAPPQPQYSQQTLPGFRFMPTNMKRCIKVESIASEMTNTHYTATDLRNLNILSYFHAIFPEVSTSSFGPGLIPVLKQVVAIGWDTSVPLCVRYPYEVDYTQAFDHVYLTGPGYEDVVPSELTRVLNGAIVGLVSSGPADKPQPTQSRTSKEETSSLPYSPAEPPPDPALSTCYGLALIRGIPLTLNPRSPHMHILTPLPPVVLARSRVLVKGEMELPIWGMLDFREDDQGRVAGIDKGHVPYLQWGKGEGVGGEKRRVRRNLMRKGQM